jgi:putative inorganic carbon (hco3(-)) transporter
LQSGYFSFLYLLNFSITDKMGKTVYIKPGSAGQWLRYQFLEKKLDTRFGYLFLSLIAFLMAYGIVAVDRLTGLIVLTVMAGFLLSVMLFKSPYFGFYFLIAFSSITTTIDRLVELPLPSGTLIEIYTYILLLSVLLKFELRRNINLRFWTNPITMGLFILFAYYMVEFFNPEMFSSLGWFSFFRKQLSYFVFYYICYCLLDSRERIIYFIRFMIVLSTIAALYACKQQWFGYSGFELRWIGTGNGYTLLLQAGMLRKFSFFSDPATSGILFAGISMLCIILLFRSGEKKEKKWLGLALVINLLGYSYSGTRTATLMIIAGILLYCFSTIFEKRTVVFLLYALLAFTLLMVMPYQNAITNRIKSTFEGSKDASAAIRDYDRHEVQPYIQAHPIGGGIFTSGGEGDKYNKGHYLEYLQADSGYLKTLAEQGPVGLALLLIFYFLTMRHGYYKFYRVRDPQIRTYYIGLLVMMFTLVVAQYAQMAISQYPVVLYFYGTLAIFIKLADFDKSGQLVQTKQI